MLQRVISVVIKSVIGCTNFMLPSTGIIQANYTDCSVTIFSLQKNMIEAFLVCYAHCVFLHIDSLNGSNHIPMYRWFAVSSSDLMSHINRAPII